MMYAPSVSSLVMIRSLCREIWPVGSTSSWYGVPLKVGSTEVDAAIEKSSTVATLSTSKCTPANTLWRVILIRTTTPGASKEEIGRQWKAAVA